MISASVWSRIGGCEQAAHRPALRHAEQHRAPGARRAQHGPDVLHPLSERGQIGDPVRKAGAALVEQDEPGEPGQAPKEARERRLVPEVLEMGNPAHDEHEIDRTAPEHLIGDVDVPAVGILHRESKRGRRRQADRQRGRLRRADDVGDEPVAAPVGGLDDPRLPGIVAERAPDLADAHLQGTVAQEHARPDRLLELVLADQPAGTRGQVLEHGQRLRSQRDRA